MLGINPLISIFQWLWS